MNDPQDAPPPPPYEAEDGPSIVPLSHPEAAKLLREGCMLWIRRQLESVTVKGWEQYHKALTEAADEDYINHFKDELFAFVIPHPLPYLPGPLALQSMPTFVLARERAETRHRLLQAALNNATSALRNKSNYMRRSMRMLVRLVAACRVADNSQVVVGGEAGQGRESMKVHLLYDLGHWIWLYGKELYEGERATLAKEVMDSVDAVHRKQTGGLFF